MLQACITFSEIDETARGIERAPVDPARRRALCEQPQRRPQLVGAAARRLGRQVVDPAAVRDEQVRALPAVEHEELGGGVDARARGHVSGSTSRRSRLAQATSRSYCLRVMCMGLPSEPRVTGGIRWL
ncbi:MAG: hypothetical protein ACRD0K_14050 [Egibacteraceae bacterium]